MAASFRPNPRNSPLYIRHRSLGLSLLLQYSILIVEFHNLHRLKSLSGHICSGHLSSIEYWLRPWPRPHSNLKHPYCLTLTLPYPAWPENEVRLTSTESRNHAADTASLLPPATVQPARAVSLAAQWPAAESSSPKPWTATGASTAGCRSAATFLSACDKSKPQFFPCAEPKPAGCDGQRAEYHGCLFDRDERGDFAGHGSTAFGRKQKSFGMGGRTAGTHQERGSTNGVEQEEGTSARTCAGALAQFRRHDKPAPGDHFGLPFAESEPAYGGGKQSSMQCLGAASMRGEPQRNTRAVS